jgi:hypothetical protein
MGLQANVKKVQTRFGKIRISESHPYSKPLNDLLSKFLRTDIIAMQVTLGNTF